MARTAVSWTGRDRVTILEGMGKKSEKRPPPSYEEGKLRDPAIEKMQDKGFTRAAIERLLQSAVSQARGSSRREDST
jgi:hypothetical protein